jgi:hypothetical protein
MIDNFNQVQPIDKSTLTYFLIFNDLNLTQEIEIPIGLDKASFEIKQNSGGYGRYLTFADGLKIGFNPRSDEFNILCDEYEAKRWQSSIRFEMRISGNLLMSSRLKMETVDTDYTYYFTVQIDSDSLLETINNKKSVEVNLVATETADKVSITPIYMQNVLTRYKEIYLQSNVSTDMEGSLSYRTGLTASTVICNIFNKTNSDPNNTVELVTDIGNYSGPVGGNGVTTGFKANNTVTVNVSIKNVGLNAIMRSQYFNRWYLYRRIILRDNSGNYISSQDLELKSWNTMTLVGEGYNEPTPITLHKNEILYYAFVLSAGSLAIEEDNDGFDITSEAEITVNTIDVFDDTTTKCTRLINIGKQILKSITNNAVTINAPRFLTQGESYYDIFATSGMFLRQYNDQPFYEKWDNFVKYIRAGINCDYQLNGNVMFFGHEMDFYRDVEIARIELLADGDVKTTANTRLVCKELEVSYDKYEDDKDSRNTLDSIHRSSTWYVPNSLPIDSQKRDVKIPYIADAYKIEYTRRESFKKDTSKTIPNDKDIYLIDTVFKDNTLMNRANEGFTVTDLFSPTTTYNLRLSPKRLMIDYYSNWLINVATYTADGTAWKNTSYLNNDKATTQTNGTEVIPTSGLLLNEKAEIQKADVGSPYLDGTVIAFNLGIRYSFKDFIELVNGIMNTRGYITIFEENTEVKVFVNELKYNWENEQIESIKGERKK